jgi:hypothetical protein
MVRAEHRIVARRHLRWHSYEPVWGWIGPLPVVHGNDCLKKMPTFHMSPVEDWAKPGDALREYDL